MIVTKSTKISALIKHNPNVIAAIASINPHFKKLQNPVLRRLFASRVTVSDASKIGGVSVSEFLNKLQEVGFKTEKNKEELISSEEKINQNKIEKSEIISLDVRPILDQGKDPFKDIMIKIKQLKINQTLEVVNTFEPIPLINILKEKGFTTVVERKKKLVYTYFKKIENSQSATLEQVNKTTISFDELYKQFIGKMNYVDVRNLEMPEPMTTILELLETLPATHCLLVDHKKIPQFLLPELKNRDFKIVYNTKSENHIQLLIYKNAPAKNK